MKISLLPFTYYRYKATGGFYRWELYYDVVATDVLTGCQEKAGGQNKEGSIEEAISKLLVKVMGMYQTLSVVFFLLVILYGVLLLSRVLSVGLRLLIVLFISSSLILTLKSLDINNNIIGWLKTSIIDAAYHVFNFKLEK